MRRLLILVLALFFAKPSFAEESIVNYESEGNLKSTRPVACVPLSSLTRAHTPADIFPGISKCVEAGAFARAIEMYAAASAFGRFDTLRVSDRTAHQAFQVLTMRAFADIDEIKVGAFQTALQNAFEDPKRMSEICSAVRKVGHPTYDPRYMIAHGMGAFVGNPTPDGLVAGFDPEAAWETSLSGFLQCPPS